MTSFEFINVRTPSRLLPLIDLERVVECLRRDGLAVLPTETGYALAAVATSNPAVRAAFAVKQRDLGNPMHIACASLEMADRYAELTEPARRLLGSFTPGPLSVVLRKRDTLPDSLVTLRGTVGIRVPDHPATLQVISALGAPVTATSLNRSGEETREPDQELLEGLHWGDVDPVPVVVDRSAVRFPAASTLVRLVSDQPEILRDGPVGAAEIERLAASETAST